MAGNAVPPEHMVAGMREALRDIGLRPGNPSQQEELAVRLLREGMKQDQLDYLWQKHLESATSKGQAVRLMAAALKQPDQWRTFISDFELSDKKWAETRERQAKKASPGPVNMLPEEAYFASEAECLGLTMDEYRVWRFERYLCCRVYGDRIPREEVAQEASMTLEELEAALERHPDVLPDARSIEANRRKEDARASVKAMRKKARAKAEAL